MKFSGQNIISIVTGTAKFVVLAAAVFLSSCESFFEDLPPCPHGVSLRFIYDYNMEYANAFHKKVDCLTVLVYDEDGVFIERHDVQGAELQDESYRMNLNLEQGTYRFLVYGGMQCDRSSFEFVDAPAADVRMEDMKVLMKAGKARTASVNEKLHDLFWGTLTLETADLYRAGTVELKKNTNNVRIVLQQVNGQPVKAEEYSFSITDDNTLFAWDNTVIPNGGITYEPWVTGETLLGMTTGGEEVIGAYAEFSTSRLTTGTSPKLVITNVKDKREIMNIPLNKYLLMLRSELYAQMKAQEFLDRESEWSVVFFLENGLWVETEIKINDWTVRIDDVEM